ncbi:MAG: hypothetical protein ACRD4X_18790 [Candidatus Acidiferrales bacterium]
MSHDQGLKDGAIDPDLATGPGADWKSRKHDAQSLPADSAPVEKIQAIMHWMSSPAAQDTSVSVTHQDRDPEDTLNNTSLLNVCGAARYAAVRLGIRPLHAITRLSRAFQAFFVATS